MKKNLGNVIAFIPVRGGSKSIPLKNIKLMNKRPLIYWVLDSVAKSKFIKTIVVSTDSEEIKKVVQKYNSDKILIVNRTKNVSTDTATTESVMLEFANKYDFEDIILVQATSPLLTTKDINNGIKKYKTENFDSVLSVVKQKRFLWKDKINGAEAINYNPLKRQMRQKFNGFLVENGAFYITSKKRLLKTKSRISGKIGLIEMPEETYFEIDEPLDWIIVESLLKEKNASTKLLSNKIKNLKCFITDCDGVLTDSGMYISEFGDEFKKFNAKDGMGFSLLKDKNFITGIITGENIQLVKMRAEKLKLDFVYLGIKNKMTVINEICEKYNLEYKNIAYIGDDINDLEVINNVGFSCAVYDAVEEIKNNADYVTEKKGGEGAVREVISLILSLRN